MLKAGAAEVVITPGLGKEIPGYFNSRLSTGIKTELYSKALVLEGKNGTCAIVVLDSLGGTEKMALAVRERASELTGIDPENILVASTHAHTASPIDMDLYGGKADLECAFATAGKAADAVKIAFDSRRNALAGSAGTTEKDISFNRRFYLRDGRVKMNQGFVNPDVVESEGPIDPDVKVIRFDDAETGEPIAVLTNFACHLDTVGGTEYCGDYPAETSRIIKRELGENVVSVFVNGCCGNINHFDFTKPRLASYKDHWKKMGRILAWDVLAAREKAPLSDADDLAFTHEYVEIKRREVSPEEKEWAEKNLGSSDAVNAIFARDICNILEAEGSGKKREPHRIPMQGIRVASAALVSVPGEVFTEIGLEIKASSGFRHTLVAELGNGNVGYVASRLAHKNRLSAKSFEDTLTSYETKLSSYVDAVPETADELVKTAKVILSRLSEI